VKAFLENFILPVLFLLCFVAFVYFLVAPPFMVRELRASGSGYPSPIYSPIVRVLESNYGSPLLWYCNTVWGAGIILLGDESVSILDIALYTIGFTGFIVALIWWIRRKIRPKVAT
jgi:hypothetical protein